jgi:beta-N-acetylhexosaminidase
LRVISLSIACLLAAASSNSAAPPKSKPKPATAVGAKTARTSKPAATAIAKSADAAAKPLTAAQRWASGMSLRDEAAQLVFIPFHGGAPHSRSREYRQFLSLVRDYKVGGLVLVNWSNGRVLARAQPHATAAFLNRMQKLARVPLLVGGDFERGASMRVDGTTVFPHAMAFGAAGDPEFARAEGEVTAREARALGVHWLFYPVADVNNNPENPIINIRSFGENPAAVAANVKAFIEGAHADRKNLVLTTAKHFPGHGDTAVDTHLNLATITADRARLDAVEFVPFRAAIAAGTDSVMTAHIAVPALAPADLPATLSPAILTGLLRQELGFKGLIATDALEMGGIVKGFDSGEAAVRAVEAGADALIMPADPEAAIRALVKAVESGRIKRARIRESVTRILAAKEKLGLARQRLVSVENLTDEIDEPESNQKAQEIADRAVTLVRNRDGAVPLTPAARPCFVVLPETRYSSQGQVFAQEVRKRQRGVALVDLDPTMPLSGLTDTVASMGACPSYVVAAYSTVAAGAGTVGLTGQLPAIVQGLLGSGRPVTLIALGNPYLLSRYPDAAAYMATFSTVPPSEIAVVKALYGEIPIRGRLPVSIPGQANYGDGIQLPGKQ